MQEKASEIQVITFQIDREVYGVDVHQIKEIIKVREYVRLPNSPASIEGVIHLRGQIIPTIDLRKAFSMEQKKSDEDTRIIMSEYNSEVVGLIVDSVIGVSSASRSDVTKPPTLTKSNANEFVTGVIKEKNQLIVVIDVVRLMESKNAAEHGSTLAADLEQTRRSSKTSHAKAQEEVIPA